MMEAMCVFGTTSKKRCCDVRVVLSNNTITMQLGCPRDVLEMFPNTITETSFFFFFLGLRLATHTEEHLEDVTRTSLGYSWDIIIQCAL